MGGEKLSIRKRLRKRAKESWEEAFPKGRYDDIFGMDPTARSEGMDVKGQCSVGYKALGGGIQFSMSADPAKVVGLSTEVSFSVGAKLAKETMVVLAVGPSEDPCRGVSFLPEDRAIADRILLASLRGFLVEGTASAAFFLGFSAGVGNYTSATSSEGADNENYSWEGASQADDGIELGAFQVDFRAGLELSGALRGMHCYLVDTAPFRLADKEQVQEYLETIARFGTARTAWKDAVVKLVRDNQRHFGPSVSLQGRTRFGHISTKRLMKRLDTGIEHKDTSDEARDLATLYKEKLGSWSDQVDPECLVRVSLGESSFSAAAIAKAAASAVIPTLALRARAGLRAGIRGLIRVLSTRFQYLVVPATRVTMTQDTAITLGQFDAGASAVAALYGSHSLTDDHTLKIGAEKSKDIYNHMSYRSTVLYWRKPEDTRLKKVHVRALKGSGVLLGESVSIGLLYRLVRDMEMREGRKVTHYSLAKERRKAGRELREKLRLQRREFLRFLWNAKPLIEALHGEEDGELDEGVKDKEEWFEIAKAQRKGAVLIEAAFAFPRDSVARIERKKPRKLTPGKTPYAYHVDKESLEPLIKEAKLQAIRLRFRRSDLVKRDKTRFNLGFGAAGNSLSIKLLSVNRVGAEAVVDLHTEWFASESRDVEHVPPVVLFTP